MDKVIVAERPKCSFCTEPAQYDGKTVMGPWANMCTAHWARFGVGLGLGRGQRLLVEMDR
jgi:hypothetical protein